VVLSVGLEGEVPDHSTFSKNRHGRFRDRDLLRKPFETVVQRCIAEGLVDGAAFAVYASLIANKQRAVAGADEVDSETIARTRRSVREYLDTLDEAGWGAASDTVSAVAGRRGNCFAAAEVRDQLTPQNVGRDRDIADFRQCFATEIRNRLADRILGFRADNDASSRATAPRRQEHSHFPWRLCEFISVANATARSLARWRKMRSR
jgi:hypothetical protein